MFLFLPLHLPFCDVFIRTLSTYQAINPFFYISLLCFFLLISSFILHFIFINKRHPFFCI
ncbi:hypothetical protein BCR42DRAFT_229607, partial [Absidia repens]